MHPDQLDGELMLAPGFPTPPNMDYQVKSCLVIIIISSKKLSNTCVNSVQILLSPIDSS